MDSTFCKVHKSACSIKKKQAIGSSRGGKNTKVHVLLNERKKLLKVILTGAQIHDSEPAVVLLKDVTLKGKFFSRIKHKVARKFVVIFWFTDFAFPTNFRRRTSSITSSSGFFSESRITATSPLVTTNWLFALRISFYSLLVLFTFNLSTDPNLT